MILIPRLLPTLGFPFRDCEAVMAIDDFRAKFVHVHDLLTQTAEAIGEGNKALVAKAETKYGTLAVKTAEVTVDFLLSSNAVKLGGDVGIGANTLFGFVAGLGATAEQQQEVSRAKIVLNIVPIVPSDLKFSSTAAGDGTSVHGPAVVVGTGGPSAQGPVVAIGTGEPGPVAAVLTKAQIARKIALMRDLLAKLKITEADRKILIAQLRLIETELGAGKLPDANAALDALIAANPGLAKN